MSPGMLRSERRGRADSCARVRTIALSLLWTLVLGGPAPAVLVKDNLYGVKVLGASEAVAVGSFGSVYRTTDAGKTWDAKNTGTTETLFSVDVVGGKTGWAVGKSAVILHTEDGGNTWRRQQSPIPDTKHLFKVAALDARTAWAVGDWGAMTATTDGGATWVDRSLGTGVPIRQESTGGRVTNTITDDVILYDVQFLDGRTGYVCGEFGTVLATRDGGATWERLETDTDKTLFGLGFASADEGWVTGMDGLLLHTTDGGRSWKVQHGRTEVAALEDLGFLETLRNPGLYQVRVTGRYGLVVGDTGLILSTKDGGKTWSRLQLPGKDRLVWMRDLSIGPDATGFVVGANGFFARIEQDRVGRPGGEPATVVAE